MFFENIFYRSVKNDSFGKLEKIKLSESNCLQVTHGIQLMLMEQIKTSPCTIPMKKHLELNKIPNKGNLYAVLSMFVDVLFIAQTETFLLFHGQQSCSSYNAKWVTGNKVMSAFYDYVDHVELKAKLIYDLTLKQNISSRSID